MIRCLVVIVGETGYSGHDSGVDGQGKFRGVVGVSPNDSREA